MWKDFKEFAFKGNVLDLAVGVIIGGAFGKIVSSLVADIIMPIFAYITAGVSVKELGFNLGEKGVLIPYGLFLQSVIDFLIIAFCIFMFIRLVNKFRGKKEEEVVEEQVKAPTTEELLSEIRDILKENKNVSIEDVEQSMKS